MLLAAVAGALGVIAQAVLVRELAVLFRNNELVLGILLCAWLAGSAAGAAGLGRIPQSLRFRSAWLLSAQMVLVLADVFIIRWLFGVWQFRARPPLPEVCLIAFALVAPAGALAGLVFSSLALFRAAGPRPSSVYVAEAFGACLGGLAFAALIAGGWHGIDVALGAFFVILVFLVSPSPGRAPVRFVVAIMVASIGLYECLPVLRAADAAGRRLQYRRTPLVFARESRWGHLALVGGDGSGAFYYNGEVIVQRDLEVEEEDVLVPALALGARPSVLVLGFCPDTLQQGLQRLGVRRLTAVFPDEIMTLFEDYGAVRRPGFTFDVRFADPFRWATVVHDKFDLVVVREPLPLTIAANRFYSLGFLAGLKAALAPGGAVCIPVPYEENGLEPHTARSLAIVRRTLSAAYASTGFVAAGRFWFLASDAPLAVKASDARRRWDAIPWRPKFVNAAFIGHFFAAERARTMTCAIDSVGPAPVNGSFTMALFRDVLGNWVRRDLGEGGRVVFIVMIALAVWAAFRWERGDGVLASARTPRTPVSGVQVWLAAAGFAGMAGEVELLFWYQSVTGVVYDLFALLTGLFMLGMAAGGRLGRGSGSRVAGLILAGWVVAVGCLFLLPVPPAGAVTDAVAFALNAIGGCALGAVFTGAARHRERLDAGAEAVSGLYAADLLGSALAAIVVPAFLVPGIGLPATAAVAVAVLVAGHAVAGKHTWD
jgi:predicted membrane-bound spermidine synthase